MRFAEQNKISWHVALSICSFIIVVAVIMRLFFLPSMSEGEIQKLQQYALQTAALIADSVERHQGDLTEADVMLKSLEKQAAVNGSQFVSLSVINNGYFKISTHANLESKLIRNGLRNKIFKLMDQPQQSYRIIYQKDSKQYRTIQVLYHVRGVRASGVELQDVVEVMLSYNYILDNMATQLWWITFLFLLLAICIILFFVFIFSLPQFQVYEGLRCLLQDDFSVRVPQKRNHFLVDTFNQVASKMQTMKETAEPSKPIESQNIGLPSRLTVRHFDAVYVCLYIQNFHKHVISNKHKKSYDFLYDWVAKVEKVVQEQQGSVIGFLGNTLHMYFDRSDKNQQAMNTAVALQSWLAYEAKEKKLFKNSSIDFSIGIANSSLLMGRLAQSINRQSIIGNAFDAASFCAKFAPSGEIYTVASFIGNIGKLSDAHLVENNELSDLLGEQAYSIINKQSNLDVLSRVQKETTFETSLSDMLQETLKATPLDIEVEDDLTLGDDKIEDDATVYHITEKTKSKD